MKVGSYEEFWAAEVACVRGAGARARAGVGVRSGREELWAGSRGQCGVEREF